MSLLEKLKKNSKVKDSGLLSESKIYAGKDVIKTDITALNIALSGEVEGGLTSGWTTIAGPSRHYKSSVMLKLIAAYLSEKPKAVCLFYDSEFGSPQEYWKSFGIDPDRVHHTPITNIEQFKFDVMSQLDGLERGDEVIIGVDSLGNLASKKEVEDALKENSAADMTRAKAFKSCGRMITPTLSIKNIPLIAVGHTYLTQEMYAKTVLSGGTGIMYCSDTVIVMGRQQDKDETGLVGYNFIMNIEKSRFVKEKSKIPLSVTFKNGIEKYSGLLELALEGGFIIKPKMGWYQVCDPVTKAPKAGSFRESDTYTAEVWSPLLASDEFKAFVRDKYKLVARTGVQSEIAELETAAEQDNESV